MAKEGQIYFDGSPVTRRGFMLGAVALTGTAIFAGGCGPETSGVPLEVDEYGAVIPANRPDTAPANVDVVKRFEDFGGLVDKEENRLLPFVPIRNAETLEPIASTNAAQFITANGFEGAELVSATFAADIAQQANLVGVPMQLDVPMALFRESEFGHILVPVAPLAPDNPWLVSQLAANPNGLPQHILDSQILTSNLFERQGPVATINSSQLQTRFSFNYNGSRVYVGRDANFNVHILSELRRDAGNRSMFVRVTGVDGRDYGTRIINAGAIPASIRGEKHFELRHLVDSTFMGSGDPRAALNASLPNYLPSIKAGLLSGVPEFQVDGYQFVPVSMVQTQADHVTNFSLVYKDGQLLGPVTVYFNGNGRFNHAYLPDGNLSSVLARITDDAMGHGPVVANNISTRALLKGESVQYRVYINGTATQIADPLYDANFGLAANNRANLMRNLANAVEEPAIAPVEAGIVRNPTLKSMLGGKVFSVAAIGANFVPDLARVYRTDADVLTDNVLESLQLTIQQYAKESFQIMGITWDQAVSVSSTDKLTNHPDKPYAVPLFSTVMGDNSYQMMNEAARFYVRYDGQHIASTDEESPITVESSVAEIYASNPIDSYDHTPRSVLKLTWNHIPEGENIPTMEEFSITLKSHFEEGEDSPCSTNYVVVRGEKKIGGTTISTRTYLGLYRDAYGNEQLLTWAIQNVNTLAENSTGDARS